MNNLLLVHFTVVVMESIKVASCLLYLTFMTKQAAGQTNSKTICCSALGGSSEQDRQKV